MILTKNLPFLTINYMFFSLNFCLYSIYITFQTRIITYNTILNTSKKNKKIPWFSDETQSHWNLKQVFRIHDMGIYEKN